MLLPPFWRGRKAYGSAGIRISRLRTVLKAAQRNPLERERLANAGLDAAESVDALIDVEAALGAMRPISWQHYNAAFRFRKPAWRRSPANSETRSAVLVFYAEARSGVEACNTVSGDENDLYSGQGVVKATADLYRLARALGNPPGNGQRHSDLAAVVFSGMDAGVLTESQRDQLWAHYQVPVFEQFLGTDGKVIATECELHAGMHIRPDAAVLESMEDEIVLTSLTDTEHPAIRVKTGLRGRIETTPCECGRVEPRLIDLAAQEERISAFAVA